MKLNLKDEPKEWRKSGLMTALGLAIASSVLRWRHVFTNKTWPIALAVPCIIVVCAIARPRIFRGWHLLSARLNSAVSQAIGRVALALFFIFIITPLGLIFRLAGKDSLQLKPPRDAASYWQKAKDCSPLDRLF